MALAIWRRSPTISDDGRKAGGRNRRSYCRSVSVKRRMTMNGQLS
jgi:hypothetical protein